jgi:hypothetical protein
VASRAPAQLVFQTPAAADGGNLALRTLVGNLNEDGLPDLVTSHWILGGSAGESVVGLCEQALAKLAPR